MFAEAENCTIGQIEGAICTMLSIVSRLGLRDLHLAAVLGLCFVILNYERK